METLRQRKTDITSSYESLKKREKQEIYLEPLKGII